VIHVYAFAAGLDELPELTGLEDRPLERRVIDGIEAVVSRREGTSRDEDVRGDAYVHGTVVEALVDCSAAVLPVRFEQRPVDDDLFAQTVSDRAPGIRRALDQVRGCVEIGVRVISSPVRAKSSSGAAYLRERRVASGAELHELIVPLASDSMPGSGTAAYLVPRGRLSELRDCVQRYAEQHPELTILCTGPWAPYSFTTEAAA
jgi:hypothetical protein